MNKNLLILGAGLCGMSARGIAWHIGCFEKIDFLDDNINIAIGILNDYIRFSTPYSYAIAAMGSPKQRLEWTERLEESCFKITTLIHPKACVSPYAKVSVGSIVEPMAVIQSDVMIEKCCIISSGAIIKSKTICANGSWVDCNATVADNTLVPAGVHIQSNTFYKNNNIRTEDLFFKAENYDETIKKSSIDKLHGPLPVDGLEYCFEDGM